MIYESTSLFFAEGFFTEGFFAPWFFGDVSAAAAVGWFEESPVVAPTWTKDLPLPIP